MREKINEKDRQLISLLKQNSRRPVSEIAAILGVSRQTVQKRIDRLVDSGTIQSFTIEVSDPEEAASSVGAKVMFTLSLRQSTCANVYASIRAWDELLRCWSISGERDMILIVDSVGVEDAERVRAKLARHPDVVSVQTSHILKTWK
ncbi:Lrp/AsnC family transcriptional regulator [Aureimonas fodinaquatilis]|uniref:Lrp/AsnC family transcriptional regulator n=1 Tax=Aureimonas fodinaquatilis TaxID=2565783 RepID=A0A5B0E0G2_9HYPH|nr:Lrp/AsnC family transcriptional regulator [Aureimonas fodinaquatilis]KAA0972118.1 Lrp/AsnC family transcriptional regulator [Aureimonas fodinaquatilis]